MVTKIEKKQERKEFTAEDAEQRRGIEGKRETYQKMSLRTLRSLR